VISGVTEHGFYVQLRDIYCEGMVRMSELRDDYYVYQPQRHALVARKRGRQFQLGQGVRVKVLRTDPDRRQIDLGLAG
jgi:ribonuclease R